jgi:hypothetical protein
MINTGSILQGLKLGALKFEALNTIEFWKFGSVGCAIHMAFTWHLSGGDGNVAMHQLVRLHNHGCCMHRVAVDAVFSCPARGLVDPVPPTVCSIPMNATYPVCLAFVCWSSARVENLTTT